MPKSFPPASSPDAPSAGISRRSVLAGMAGGAAALAAGGLPDRAIAQATPGKGTKYRLDLGGYNGPELTDKPVTLRFMRQDFSPAVNAQIEESYARFTKAYPNITIKEEKVPYGDLTKKLQLYVQSGDAPDIMMGRMDFGLAYDAGKIALPLQNYLAPDYIEDITPSLRETASANGNLYCVPWEQNLTMLCYNKKLLDLAGVEPPPEVTDLTKGWTVEQFLDALARIKSGLAAKGDTTSWALAAATQGNGGPGSNYAQLESLWIRSQGDPKAPKGSSLINTFLGVSEDGLKVSGYLDTPEAVKGMTYYQSMFTKGLTPTGPVPNQFPGGVAAMFFGGLNIATRFALPGQDPGFPWGISAYPIGNIPFSVNPSDSPLVWAKSPNPAEAAALLAFLCNDENRIRFHRTWGSMPARRSLLKMMDEFQTKQPFQLAANVGAAAYSAPRSVGWFDYFNAVNPAVKDIALGADPAKTLQATARKIDGLLAKYRT